MVYYFLEGGAFMWPILLTLLFGLAFVIERAYSLMMSAVDSQTFFESVSRLTDSKNVWESTADIISEYALSITKANPNNSVKRMGHINAPPSKK